MVNYSSGYSAGYSSGGVSYNLSGATYSLGPTASYSSVSYSIKSTKSTCCRKFLAGEHRRCPGCPTG